MKWTGKGKYPREQERERKRMLKEAEAYFEYRRHLQVVKDKLDLYGEEALTQYEGELVGLHHDFFYPEEG